jgi:hypothetical protein
LPRQAGPRRASATAVWSALAGGDWTLAAFTSGDVSIDMPRENIRLLPRLGSVCCYIGMGKWFVVLIVVGICMMSLLMFAATFY